MSHSATLGPIAESSTSGAFSWEWSTHELANLVGQSDAADIVWNHPWPSAIACAGAKDLGFVDDSGMGSAAYALQALATPDCVPIAFSPGAMDSWSPKFDDHCSIHDYHLM